MRTLKGSETHFGVDCILSTAAMFNEFGSSHKASVCPHVSDANSSKSESCLTFNLDPDPTPHPDTDRLAVVFEPFKSTVLSDDAREEHCHSGSHLESAQLRENL